MYFVGNYKLYIINLSNYYKVDDLFIRLRITLKGKIIYYYTINY